MRFIRLYTADQIMRLYQADRFAGKQLAFTDQAVVVIAQIVTAQRGGKASAKAPRRGIRTEAQFQM